MFVEKDENGEIVLKIKEIEPQTKFFMENKTYQMEVRLVTPEAKTVILLSHRKKMPDGSFRSTMINREEHFGWAVWVLREKGFIPAPEKDIVFEIFNEKTQQALEGFPVYVTETEAYRAYSDVLFYRGLKGEAGLEAEGEKSVEMLLYEMEPWERFQLFDFTVRPVHKKDVSDEKLKQLVTYSIN